MFQLTLENSRLIVNIKSARHVFRATACSQQQSYISTVRQEAGTGIGIHEKLYANLCTSNNRNR